MELTPTLILNLALLIVPPVALVLVFRQWLARHIRWTVALTALCDVLLFWDELFYYESFGLFAVLILVQLAATGAAACGDCPRPDYQTGYRAGRRTDRQP